MIEQHIKESLLKNALVIFPSDYGKKAVATTWAMRLKNQIKQVDEFKPFQNYNIATGGDSLIVDVDLDCPEALELADRMLTPTGMEFGRESTKGSHRIYKVIDLTKKNTRAYFDFKGLDKSMLVELRMNKHYTMCAGQYDNQEKVVWSKCEAPVEITYDVLFKQCALLSVASVILRKCPVAGTEMRNEYWKLVIATLWYAKVSEEDCSKIVEAVCIAHKDDTNERLARVKSIYAKDRTEQLLGLPTLATEFNWSEDETKDFRKLLLKITGRHLLPEATNDFVNRIAYMMKQKKYYDLEDQEMYDGESIDIKYAKDFDGKYTPLKFWKLHKDRKVCVDFTYQPSDPKRFVYVKKKFMINVYEKNDVVPDPKADTDLFHALVKDIIPEEEYREHFLNWFAYPIQQPGKKIRHALMLQSDVFQCGKGSLFDIHRDILGHNNTRKIDLKEALDKAKGYLINKQTVLIDEAKASGSWSEKNMFVNTLKTLITESTGGVRQMYVDFAEKDTCTNYWINTNYRDAFPLPSNEARYFVYFSPSKRNEKLLDKFHLAREHGNLVQGVMAEMLDRNLSKFNALGTAPITPYLQEMTRMADKPINDYILEQFTQGIDPLNRELITVTELFDWVSNNTKIRVTRPRELGDALKNIGGILKASCPVHALGNFVNVWIIRNHEKYKNMTAKEVGMEYKPFATGRVTTRQY